MARLRRGQLAERIQVVRLDHQRLAVKLEEEHDAGGGERRPEQPRVGEHGIEIEGLDPLERPRSPRPAATARGCIEHVGERALQARDRATAPAGRRSATPPSRSARARSAAGASTGTNSSPRNAKRRCRARVR